MRRLVVWIISAAAALGAAAPAAAQHHAAATPRSAYGYHRSPLAVALGARIQSIQTRIEMLREEGQIGGDEARNLRQQLRDLQRRLIGLSNREAGDVELGINRLDDRVRFAADEGRWNNHVYDREDEERYESRHAYSGERDRYYENLDRHVAPPVDRWDDPFDRGNDF